MNKKVGEYIESHKMAFWIAACYVGFGTLAVCSVYPADIFYGSWSIWGLLITLFGRPFFGTKTQNESKASNVCYCPKHAFWV